MKINIDKIRKVNTIKCRPIYEVVEKAYFKEYENFPDDFMKQCKDNENEAQFIQLQIKNNIKRMEMEQGLYAKVVKLRQKDLKFIAANRNKNEAKFKFQGLSEISQCWFHLEYDWIEVSFSTREPDFYNNVFQSHDDTQDTNTFKLFLVPIGNSKCVEMFKFHTV